jgi:serine/threonine-protein kinase
VLEFIDGPTAHTALVAHGRLPAGIVVRLGIDIARALDFLHQRHYVHRDVKPDNVLFHPDGVAKLADLGLAKRLNDDPSLTSISRGVGTSYYMSYEQSRHPDLVDGRSDVFALGATLYHLVTGELPFPGATHEEIVRGKETDDFRPVAEHEPHVPRGLADIIATALARDPRARFQSADEFALALESTGLSTPIPAFAHGETAGGTRPETPTRVDGMPPEADGAAGWEPPPASPSLRPPPGSDDPPLPRLRGGVFPLLLAVTALTGVAALAFAARPTRPDNAPSDHTHCSAPEPPAPSGPDASHLR